MNLNELDNIRGYGNMYLLQELKLALSKVQIQTTIKDLIGALLV